MSAFGSERLGRVTGRLESHDKGRLGRLSNPAGRNVVKPEQASKVTMRMPTLLRFGEGCMSGEARAPARSAG
jgi:hypothetical protein